MNYTSFKIPNLYESPYSIDKNNLNNIEYNFEYKWSIREDCAYLSIYSILDDEKTYIIRDTKLVLYIDLLKFAKEPNISGNLVFENINLSLANPNIKNLHTDYQLVYTTEE